MTATNHTANCGLSPFEPSDYSSWQGDYIEDMLKTGSAIHHITSNVSQRDGRDNGDIHAEFWQKGIK